jgi:hypothetical protein
MTKNFKEYLAESCKKWDFRIKVAGEFNEEKVKTMEALLNKFQVSKFKKVGTTPIQSLPLDFPKIRFAEVTIFEAVVDYPTTQMELQEYLCTSLGITKDALVVRRPGEPSESYQEPHEPHEGALLTDSEYKEVKNAKFDEYYGDKYNESFLKELNDVLKLQRKARGEEIPSETKVHFNTDDKPNNKSPVEQAADPRKK